MIRIKKNDVKTVLFHLLLLFVAYSIIIVKKDTNTETLFFLTWVNNVVFIIEVFYLVNRSRSFDSPVIFFNVLVFLFTSGQLLLFSLNITPIGYNVFRDVSVISSIDALRFSIPAYIFFSLGNSISINIKQRRDLRRYQLNCGKDSGNLESNVRDWGIIFLLLGILPFSIVMGNNLIVVLSSGYSAYYEESARVSNVWGFFSYYFYVGILLIWATGKAKIKKFCLFVLLVVIILFFIVGDRGSAISLLIALYMLNSQTKKYTKNSNKVILVFIVVIAMASIQVIADWRSIVNLDYSFYKIISRSLIENNILVSTLSNLGGTLFPLTKTIELVPSGRFYLLGGSYLTAVLYLIPSFLRVGFLNDLDRMLEYSSPGSWLMQELSLSYGPGYTPFAEAYLNFGRFGVVFMGFLGYFFAKILSISYFKENKNISIAMQALSFFLFSMSARASINYLIAFWVRYILLPIVIIRFLKLPRSK